MEVMQDERNRARIQLFSVENTHRKERKELKEKFVIIIKNDQISFGRIY